MGQSAKRGIFDPIQIFTTTALLRNKRQVLEIEAEVCQGKQGLHRDTRNATVLDREVNDRVFSRATRKTRTELIGAERLQGTFEDRCV